MYESSIIYESPVPWEKFHGKGGTGIEKPSLEGAKRVGLGLL